MMVGNNTIVINTATMIEAMQEYFDKRYTPKFKVIGVSKDISNTTYSSGTGDSYKVSIEAEASK